MHHIVPSLDSSGISSQPFPSQQSSPAFTLATANPPFHHPNSLISRPSPVPSSLRKQTLKGNYIDLALLLMPSLHQPPAGRFLEGHKEPSQQRGRSTTRSREFTPTEFAYAFSLYRDVLCSCYPGHHQEMDDYLAIILNLALRFGSNGFYQHHIHFASEAAARLQQFNEDTYWGSLDNEIYRRIFAACAALPCSPCRAPSHPASSCSIPAHAKPRPPSARITSFSHLSAAAPLAFILKMKYQDNINLYHHPTYNEWHR